MSEYPEHDKVKAIQHISSEIGMFLDWLRSKEFVICEWTDGGTNGEPKWLNADSLFAELNPRYESWPAGYFPVRKSVKAWLEEYFEIDGEKFEEENNRLLEKLRAIEEE